jgi:hypothetical protein
MRWVHCAACMREKKNSHGFEGETWRKETICNVRLWCKLENNETCYNKIGCYCVDCVHLAQNGDKWWVLVNTVMSLQVPYSMGNLYTSRGPIGISGRVVLSGVNSFFGSCVVWPVINWIPVLISLPNTLFVQVDLACVYLLIVEIGCVVNVVAIVMCRLHVKVTMQLPCWYTWYKSISQWELLHSICHVIASTGHYMTTIWGTGLNKYMCNNYNGNSVWKDEKWEFTKKGTVAII